jgi:hypothetical protein
MRTFLALCVVFAAACGSKSSTSTTPTGGGDTGSGSAATALPDVPFDQLDHDQQIEYMKTKVVPAMEPIFKNHNPTKFAEFGCKTCHGPGAEKGEFEMPNAGLPVLDFKDPSKYKKEDMEWMGGQVKPTMAKLLGETEYSPENPTGFGCGNCHTVKM